MPDPVNLSGELTSLIENAEANEHPFALAYVREDGAPSVSYRGGLVVLEPNAIGLWARSRDGGLPTSVATNPKVSLVFWRPAGSGISYLVLNGRARVAPEFDDKVFEAIGQEEQQYDPERNGVTVLIEVDTVEGYSAEDGELAQSNLA